MYAIKYFNAHTWLKQKTAKSDVQEIGMQHILQEYLHPVTVKPWSSQTAIGNKKT